MQIVLIRKNEITKTVLPAKVGGQHFITYKTADGDCKPLIAITAVENDWVIKANKKVDLLEDLTSDAKKVKEIRVVPNEYYPIAVKSDNEIMILLAEPVSKMNGVFTCYRAPYGSVIKIGHNTSDDICFQDDLLSETVCAEIIYSQNGQIRVRDTGSTNGTYVNSKRIQDVEANFGDELYLMGLRVIIGNEFVSVNNPNGCVTVALQPLPPQEFTQMDMEDDEEEDDGKDTFSSAPRSKREIQKKKITIDPPPKPADNQELPWAVVMGPSITMAFASVFSSVFTIQNIMSSSGDFSSVLPTLVMSVCMVLGTLIWPVFAKRFEKRSRETKEAIETKEYLAYLEKVGGEIDAEIKLQEEIKRENHPALESCIARINNRNMTLWERSPRHNDFLEVMLGMGEAPADIELSYSQRNAVEKVGKAGTAMYKLAETKRTLKNVPITIPFAKTRVSGIIGDREKVRALTKALLLELTALHNYDDLKIMFVYDEKERDIWDFVKWMPHIWNKDKTVRFLSNDIEEAKELSALIANIQAVQESQQKSDNNEPHYLIIVADRILADKIQALKDFCQNPAKYEKISLLALYDERKYLPKSCSIICTIDEKGMNLSDFNSITGESTEIASPALYNENPESSFINMANIELDATASERLLPTELTYFEMFESGKPEHLDILAHWEESNSVKTLAAPIGVDANGYPIKLDIHEKAHGPHGLIAGMTGSGKSEFIISYIASLATHFSPEEVSFVLIDFKGGGMADVFKNLPHLAGSITNLDGNELQRSFIAIESALEKRQKLFKEISEQKKISNIDIYKYHKLRQEDKTLKPLPHLIIISDEFAELKQQHSDFMEQLIRIARIGRSLGVHLILATQKPDGVVDDQIKSNIKFKVCLKVQDKADSQSVIDRPDATLITNAGRFYMQVGFNEVFEYGQSPWSGATYYPADQYRKNQNKRIDVLNEQGRVMYQIRPPEAPRPDNVPEKQIDALVEYLQMLSIEKGFAQSKLWMSPLDGPASKDKDEKLLDSDARPFVLNPVIGNYDDLRNQKHQILTLPLSDTGNAIVYGSSGSGKLAFINQMVVSLMERHTPEELSVFAVDYDSGSLSAFEEAPHVRSVIPSGELDAVQSMFNTVNEEIENRKELFKRFSGDYYSYIKSSGHTLPNLVIVIHNFFAFTEDYSEGEEIIAKIAREGRKYGIFVVLTAIDSNAVRYKLTPLFSNIYVLQMNNDEQYTDILGKTGGIKPSKFKGRGILKFGESTYEFQTKMVFEGEENNYDAIAAFSKQKCEESGYVKEKLKPLPKSVTLDYFKERETEISLSHLPVAIERKTLNPLCLDITASKITFIANDEEQPEVSDGIIQIIASQSISTVCIDSEGGVSGSESMKVVADKGGIEALILEIEAMVAARGQQGLECIQKNEKIPDFSHEFFIINGFSSLYNAISADGMFKLVETIVGITDNYHIHFIIIDNAQNFRFYADADKLKAALPVVNGVVVGEDTRGPLTFNPGLAFPENCEKGYGYVVENETMRHGKMVVGRGDKYGKTTH